MGENEEIDRELHDMEERTKHLEDEIEDEREDWERKKRDPSVPGATGDPDRAEEELPPQADEPGG
jgi:predicted  nucleic acid-binding Zn-ribbon protein